MADRPVQSHRVLRFGPFELDTSTGELRKHGVRIRLQEQPFRLLLRLLQTPGEAVTREELIRAIWTDGTFVDYERGLNAAVTRIRQALTDSAERPRYVETVARKGYRFIAPVEEVVAAPPATEAAAAPEAIALLPVAPVEQSRRRYGVWLAAILCSTVLALAGFLWKSHKSPPKETRLIQLTHGTGLTMEPALSPDGKLLAYVSDRGGRTLNLWIQQLGAGGNAVQLTHGNSDIREPAFSPDGDRIAFWSEEKLGGISMVPSIGGSTTRVVPHGRSPRFSPDGKWISYWQGNQMTSAAQGDDSGETYVIPAAGGEPKRIATDLTSAVYPVWAPDSRHLLVYVNPRTGTPGERDWWVASLDGAASRRTGAFGTLARQGIAAPAESTVPRAYDWTGEKIAFSAMRDDTLNCWRVPISLKDWSVTAPAERLTSGTTLEVSPRPSHDRLIFSSLTRTDAIWSLAVDENGTIGSAVSLKRLTDGGAETTPSISADGRLLSFTSHRMKNADVWLKDLETGEERAIAATSGAEWHPQLSRDGSTIAYTYLGPGPHEIRIVPSSGGVPKGLTEASGWVTWIGNNRLLKKKASTDPDIYAVALSDGRKDLFLSKAGDVMYQARFSPDEKWVALEAVNRDPKRHGVSSILYVAPTRDGFPAPHSQWIGIGDREGWNDKPRWSMDGNRIFFISHRDGFRCLWFQALDPLTKRPQASPVAVHHFHEARLS
ncbi:MAG TPA: winged helix-turn-helix domain-containing protein, partial [Bryobacteraceae bacterium]|nr:winged helix-turn-helix domain-containing protein [Bryobacteraceae bacterium]